MSKRNAVVFEEPSTERPRNPVGKRDPRLADVRLTKRGPLGVIATQSVDDSVNCAPHRTAVLVAQLREPAVYPDNWIERTVFFEPSADHPPVVGNGRRGTAAAAGRQRVRPSGIPIRGNRV